MRMRVAWRLLGIQRALVRHGLDEYVRETHLFRPVRFLLLMSPWTWFQRTRGSSRGERLRLALEELGPIFVKFGQALSTRPDLLPADIATELARLQDRVPPFPAEQAQTAIEASLGGPVENFFDDFQPTAVAAASIAQVHAARLKDGTEVVVKVLRPGMHEVIRRDIEVLHALADLADRYWSGSRRLRPREVVAEYEKTVFDELDLMREAANAAQLKRNFAGSSLLYVPRVYWDLCRRDVMVMERIHGIIISHVEELKAHGTDMARLAENGVEIFFTQVFSHNFFHADMHPGNIFVQVDDPQNPRYAAVDFGIVGTLQERDQHYLAENFMAFFERDYRRIARLHIESGWVPRGTRLDELESAVRTVCEPIFNKPLAEISFAQVLLRLFETARRFDMRIQPQLILLQKTLLNIEGLGRQLYPQLDLWKTAQPVLRKFLRDRISPLTLARQLRHQLPDLVQAAKLLPVVFQNITREAAEGRFALSVQSPGLAELREELRRGRRRRDGVLLGAVIWLGGATSLVIFPWLPLLGWGLMILGTGVAVYRLRAHRESP